MALTTTYWDWFQQIAVGANEDRRALWYENQPTEGKTLLTASPTTASSTSRSFTSRK